MITSIEEYLNSVNDIGKEWLLEFYQYMNTKHSELKPVMFRQRPMYKINKSYIMFTAAKQHFSLHTIDFDLINKYQHIIPNSGNAKGCLNIKYSNVDAKPLLKELCDLVVERNMDPNNTAATGTAPEMSYEEHMAQNFPASKAVWRPLYDQLKDFAIQQLPEFHEYFPAIDILWKHTSTFATIKVRKAGLQIEFFSDQLHEDRKPTKILELSKNRIAHTIEITNNKDFPLIIEWIKESYLLTKKK